MRRRAAHHEDQFTRERSSTSMVDLFGDSVRHRLCPVAPAGQCMPHFPVIASSVYRPRPVVRSTMFGPCRGFGHEQRRYARKIQCQRVEKQIAQLVLPVAGDANTQGKGRASRSFAPRIRKTSHARTLRVDGFAPPQIQSRHPVPLPLMRLANYQLAPHQQRAGNARQRHEQQNSNQRAVAGIADRAGPGLEPGPCKLANANHGEPNDGL